jgi:GNAT superfamily N-acetyltransferase
LITIKKIDSIDQLSELKQEYMNQATAPLDGMWLAGFVPMADHFGFYEGEELVGYFCVNSDRFVLQFYLAVEHQNQAGSLFASIMEKNNSEVGEIAGAFASTAEPNYLSRCLDQFTKFKVNALMYQRVETARPAKKEDIELQLVPVRKDQLAELVTFANSTIGAPVEWLEGYYANLISRQELYAVWQNDTLIAAGECRGYDEYQTEYADLGMLVAKTERGKGIATMVLIQLLKLAESQGLKPICSTEMSNIGAQKAISRAGFYAPNRIIEFSK